MAAAPRVPPSFIASTLSFVANITASRNLVFFWLDSRLAAVECRLVNISPACQKFMERIGPCDPLSPRVMTDAGKSIGWLSSDQQLLSSGAIDEYRGSLRGHGFVDEIDMLLRTKSGCVAGISAFRDADDAGALPALPAFADIAPILEKSIPYIEFNLGRHLGADREGMQREFVDAYGLTRREAEIAELIGAGCTNCEIASCLGVGVATVKTHIFNLFRKVGIENRSSLVALLPR